MTLALIYADCAIRIVLILVMMYRRTDAIAANKV